MGRRQKGGDGAGAGDDVPRLLHIGMEAHRAGRLAEAETHYLAVLAIDPDQPDALNLAGVAAFQQGRAAEGRARLERAAALRPDDLAITDNLGLLLFNIGDSAAALPVLERALRLLPPSPPAGPDTRRAVIATRHARTLFLLGRTLDAVAAYRRALDADPDHGEALTYLAEILARLGQTDEAGRLAERAVALLPDDSGALHVLGLVRQYQNRPLEAEACWSRVAALAPPTPGSNAAGAVWNRSLLRLARGDLAQGWQDYESRFDGGTVKPIRHFSQPRWQGEALPGRCLLIWREQGLGDEIMFAGLYRPVIDPVLAGGGRVVIEAEPRLLALLRRSLPSAGVTLRAPTDAPADIDVHIPAGSLPGLLGPALLSAMPPAGWLRPDPALVADWRTRLPGGALLVGLCWTSGFLALERRGNYTALADWRALLALPGVRVVDLQYQDTGAERADLARILGCPVDQVPLWRPPGLDQKDDQDGLAALLSCLDLVVSAPTAVGELAAAVGTPVWRISGPGDWSMLGTAVRPWFPTMRVMSGVDGSLEQAPSRVVAELSRLLAVPSIPVSAPAPVPVPPSPLPPPPPIIPTPGPVPSLAEAFTLHEGGRWAEALSAYQRRLAAYPADAETWHLFGLFQFQRGDSDAAAAAISRALDLHPTAMAANNLANVLRALGRYAEADARYTQALSLDPALVEARANRGVARQALDRLDAAEADLRAALAAAPDRVETLVNLASLLSARGRADDALAAARQAVRLGEAGGAPPDILALAHTNVGSALTTLGQLAAAEDAYTRALGQDPGQALARFNLSLIRLAQGALDAGWQGYEARFGARPDQPSRSFPIPRWQGQDLHGRSLLVWREQGLGDELLFASLYPALIRRAAGAGTMSPGTGIPGEVVIECDPRLVGLFARSLPGAVVRAARSSDARPGADYEIAAGSLPGLLCPDLADFAAAIAAAGADGYLRPDPARVALWRDRLAAACGGQPRLRLGICWRSGLRSEERAGLYSQLRAWAPILTQPGLCLVTLQYDAAEAEAEIRAVEAELGIRIHRWPDLDLRDDLDGVAALTAGLDLVISAATAVAELAGALGVPCWRLGAQDDWTRLGTGARPWFPSQRAFIKPHSATIDTVLAEVAGHLARLAQAAPARAALPAALPPAPPPPVDADALVEAALAAERSGRRADAEPLYRQALAAVPAHPVALYRLGLLRRDAGDLAAAVDLLAGAVAALPDFLVAQVALAFAQLDLGQARAAADSFRRALALKPDAAEVMSGLGAAMSALGDEDGAIACQRRATQIRPDWAGGWINLGIALFNAARFRPERLAEARAAYEQALVLAPGDADALTNLGNMHRLAGRLDQAAACQRQALAARPDHPDAILNLALVLADLGRPAEAEPHLRRALALRPGWPLAAWNLALERLRVGALAEGWDLYEARFAAAAVTPRRDLRQPPWQGESLAGRRLLVWREQGLGDEILFATLLPALAARVARDGGRLVVELDGRLRGLLARGLSASDLLARESAVPELVTVRPPTDGAADTDCHVPVGSLPRLLAPTLAALTAAVPVSPPLLRPDPDLAARWRDRLVTDDGAVLKVGLCWKSGLNGLDRRGLYLALADFAPLLTLPGVAFHALQYDQPEAEIAAVEAALGVRLRRWSDLDQKNDLDGVAALMSGLDLVISAATAVGELAAAVGVPVWRFQQARNWSSLGTVERPWFPGQRMFTPAPGAALVTVVAAMADELRRLSAPPAAPPPSSPVPPPSDRVPSGPPDSPAPAPSDLAAVVAAHQAGDLAAAEAGYRAHLARHPRDVDALHLLGVLLSQTGRADQGLPLVDQAVALAPTAATLRNSQGALRRAAGDLAAAAAAFQKAVDLDPADAQAWGNLGGALVDLGRGDAALAALDRAAALLAGPGSGPEAGLEAALSPDQAKVQVERAQALRLLGRTGAARTLLDAVVRAAPSPYAWTHLGLARGELDDKRGAVAAHRRALALDPGYGEAANNLGMALLAVDDVPAAAAAFAQALDARPDLAIARYNQGLLRLATGHLPDGWADHEVRFAAGQARPVRTFPRPRWRGEDLRGRRLLVWREQGLGDELMFGSLLPDLLTLARQAGGALVVECDPRLVRLLSRALPGAAVRAAPPDDAPAPDDCDWHCPLGSLPGLLRPRLADWGRVGGLPPFLTPDPGLAARWRDRVAALGPGLRVGICWRSGLGGRDRADAYTALGDWGPVLRLPGVRALSLQYDMPEGEIAAAEAALGVSIARWPDLDLRDDQDGVAALMAACDLVITAPTAVGELAGALGVPCWRIGTRLDWSQLGTAVRPWFASMDVMPVASDEDAAACLPRVAARLTALLAAPPPVSVVSPPTPVPPPPSPPLIAPSPVTPIPPPPGGPSGDDQLRQAIAHQRAGRLNAAATLYRAVLRQDPDRPEALHLLGLIAGAQGRGEEAVELISRAVAVDPDYRAARVNLGNQLQTLGRAAEAEAQYRAALAGQPDAADILSNLGNALSAQGRLDDALACHRRAVALAPGLAAAWRNLGAVLLDLDQPGEAADAYRRALGAGEDARGGAPDPDALTGLGEALRRQGRAADALVYHDRALALLPVAGAGMAQARARVFNNRARTRQGLGDETGAEMDFRAALALDADLPVPRFNLGMADLKAGRLTAGWAGYECRFAADTRHPRPRFAAPDWRGEDLRGLRLRVWREQGLGDELLFARLYPALAARARAQGAAGLLIEADPRLVPLFRRGAPSDWQADGFLSFLPTPPQPLGRQGGPAPLRDAAADRVIAAGSLPSVLAGSLDAVAAGQGLPGWLAADPARVTALRHRLDGLGLAGLDTAAGGRLVLGIAWRSGLGGSERSPLYSRLDQWRHLLAVPGLLPVSLHYQPASEEIAGFQARTGVTLHHFPDLDLRDDLETAAALTAACDLVISPATAVGELAGALGVPCWRFAPRDWTTLGTAVRPFFPGQRLFDLESLGGVDAALAAMRAALLALARG